MVAPPPVPLPVRAPSERVDAPPLSGLVVVPFAVEPDEKNARWRDFPVLAVFYPRDARSSSSASASRRRVLHAA
jgi:hypothetical protein